MIDAVSNAIQLVPLGGSVMFENTRIMTGRTVRHEEGSARFVLLAPGIYSVHFSGNIAVPTGETVGPISVALSVDGETITGSDAIITPAAVEEYGNVSVTALVPVYGCGRCLANVGVAVVNTSDIPINVQDANLVIIRECGGGNA
jgi:hypothetical protein